MKIKNMVQKYFTKQQKVVTTSCIAVAAMAITAIPASAAVNTGDTDIDAALASFETSFESLKSAFWYLALAAIPVTLAVIAFFWLRGKFKQAVSGA